MFFLLAGSFSFWFPHQSSCTFAFFFLWKTDNGKINFLKPATHERGFFFLPHIYLLDVSFPFLYDCLVRGGLVLTGSWWGVRRDANSHNLSLGADWLVARKFIQRVLSLHLPYFEVALSTLACRTWLCVQTPPHLPSPKETAKKKAEMKHSCVSIPMYVFLPVMCVPIRVCCRVVLCAHAWVCV